MLLVLLVSVLGIPFMRLFAGLADEASTGIPYLFDVNYHLSVVYRWCIELNGTINGSSWYIEMLGYFTKMFETVFLDTDITLAESYLSRTFVRSELLKPGMVIVIPANIKHWHGAKKDEWFSHIAIEVPGENGSTEWCEPMDDEYYNKL